MQEVLGGVEQHVGDPRQRRDQQRAAGGVGGRVPMRHRGGQGAPRLHPAITGAELENLGHDARKVDRADVLRSAPMVWPELLPSRKPT